MPSSEAQAALIKRVYESHGLDYGSTQVVTFQVLIHLEVKFPNRLTVRGSAWDRDQSRGSSGNKLYLQDHWPASTIALEALDW